MPATAASFDATKHWPSSKPPDASNLLSPGAVKNVRDWLTEPRYAEYAPQVAEHLAQRRFQELDDVFWTIIPFGTGGRRGKMYPIGSNAINDRTIGESAQGLADYINQTLAATSCRAPSPTTRGIARAILPSCAPK